MHARSGRRHDPQRGHTLYGVEIIIDPTLQGHGLGHKLLAAQKELATRRQLRRMRGGARLRDYHSYAAPMKAPDYVVRVVHGQIEDRRPSITQSLTGLFHLVDSP